MNDLMKAVFSLTLAMAKAEAEEQTDEYDENGKPKYLLCDEIWDILDEAGHGTPVLIHRKGQASEVVLYNRYASQTDNVRFMNHISEAMDDGCLVTVNGTNIFDLY